MEITRGVNSKLGFHFKTFQCGRDETVTVVVKVKPDCQLTGGFLSTTDRILRICNVPVTTLGEAEVYRLLGSGQPTLQLFVATMDKADPGAQVKRFLSVNSGTSTGSGTASVDSTERPQVKRFAKSDSLEAASPPPSTADHDPLTLSSDLSGLPTEAYVAVEIGGAVRGRFLPHLTTTAHSLPITMEDEIILQLCEAGTTHSLPPVLSPHPIAPPIPILSTHRAAFLTTTGIGGIGSVAEGGESAAGVPSNANSLGVEVCRAPGCQLQNCLWHKFVLSNPQYIIWDPATKTVVLDKNGSATFGFKYKVKKHDGPPAELFALVTEVTPGGVAWNRLLPGDWIRSIDGTAIDTAKGAFRFEFSSLSSLRLVLQRPDGLSPRAATKLKQLAKTIRVPFYIPPAQREPAPIFTLSPQKLPSPAARYISGPFSPQGFVRQGSGRNRESMGIGGGSVFSSPMSAVTDPREHIPLATLVRTTLNPHGHAATDAVECGCMQKRVRSGCSASNKCALPRARVVICGSHGSATEFVHGLLSDNGEVVKLDAYAQCFQLSMEWVEESGVQIHTWPQPFVSLMENGEDVCSGQRRLNLELYVISDEDFFHHCASWLLPSASVIVLTFDIYKLMNKPESETSRLAAMVHTVRTSRNMCSTSSNPTIVLYGVSSGSESGTSTEEVQAIFYVTSYGHQLLEHYALNVPEVAQTLRASSMADARSTLFEACLQQCQQNHVHRSAGVFLDALTSCLDLHLSYAKLMAMHVKLALDVDLDSLLRDLIAAGSLIPQGHSTLTRPLSEQAFIIPFNVLQSLLSLLIKPDVDSHSPASRQKWFKLLTQGRVSRAELCSVLAADSPHHGHVTLDLLENLGIVFRLHPPSVGRGDSGFAEEAMDYIMPYFLFEDHQPQKAEGKGQQFVMTFSGRVSLQNYYDMLSVMSQLPATEAVEQVGKYTCNVSHNGMSFFLHLRKHSDSIHMWAARSDGKSRETIRIRQLEQLFGCVVPPGMQFSLCTAESMDPNSGLLSGREVASFVVQNRPSPVDLATGMDQQETTLKTLPSLPGASLTRQMSKPSRDAPLTSLPWSALKTIAIRLSFETISGPTWKDVAEQAGKSSDEIFAYEALATKELPALIFLKEWAQTASIQQLLGILERLERPDVHDIILEYL